MPTINYRITKFIYYLIAIVFSVFVITFPPINIFAYDVFGYYMYLPFTFKYHDLNITHIETVNGILNTYHNSETFYQAVKWDNGNWVMRYPIGLSVLYAPFYFIADLIAPYTSYKTDGFSKPYQLSVLYGCLFYSLIGLHFVKKILQLFFSDVVCAFTLFSVALGTNYAFHVSLHGQGAMSHNILFSLYAVVIFFTIKWYQTFKVKYIVFLGLSVGLAALCRPTEILCVLIPLLYGVKNFKSIGSKFKLLLHQKKQILIFSFIIISIGFIQFGYWYYSADSFFVNPYGEGNPGEGLELGNPHILKVLFSFRKGWFIYTPIMLFAMHGFWFLYKKNRDLFTPVFTYFCINLYIVSSWSCWWYGSCFGNRALIVSYATLCIPIGYSFEYWFKTKLKPVVFPVVILLVSYNIFQSWQLNKGILDPTNMSRRYYFSTFLQIKMPTEAQTKLLLRGKFNDGNEIFTQADSSTHMLGYQKLKDFEKDFDPKQLCDTVSKSGRYSYMMVPGTESNFFCITDHVEDVTKKTYTWIKGSVWVYPTGNPEKIKASFAIHMKHKGWMFKVKEYFLNSNELKANTWNKIEHYYLVPDDLRSRKDEICVFFTNQGESIIYIDDMQMQSYEPIVDQSYF